MSWWKLTVASLFLALTAGRSLEAQSARDLMSEGIAAYQELELDTSRDRLERALATEDPKALADSARAGAYMYLGAIAVLDRRREDATEMFTKALEIDPRYRPDPLIFPPEILGPFQTARRHTRYVRADASRDTTIVAGAESFATRLYTSTPQRISVDLMREDGSVARRLHSGPVEDSLDIGWDGLALDGKPLEGRLVMRIASYGSGDERVLRIPLQVRALQVDSAARPTPPARPVLPPDRGGSGRALRAGAVGIAAGLAAVFLPKVIADEDVGTSTRYLVGGALGVAGVVGIMTQASRERSPENMAANEALRDAWEREVAAAREASSGEAGPVRLVIRAGDGTVEEESR
jgi:tetratricopeptide (TPR) repeat protein